MLFAFLGYGCTPSDETESPAEKNPIAIIGKQEASELLFSAIDNYKARPFQELISEVGIGDDYYMIAKGDDGSKAGYSISIENEWYNKSGEFLLITATIFGPTPTDEGIVPELHRESLVVERY